MAGGITQDTVVVNDLNGLRLEQRTRTTSRGTSVRYSIGITSEPILNDLDPIKLGDGPAQAIMAVIRKQIMGIMERTSLATQKRRESAEKAFAAGDSWAMRRYGGGRTGPTPPNQTQPPRKFNDSNRLARGLAARENKVEKTWTINVPANRLDPTTFVGGAAAMVGMFQDLKRLVPALANPKTLLDAPEVLAALNRSIRQLAVTRKDLVGRIFKAGIGLARTLSG
jgi:hypothetical protein